MRKLRRATAVLLLILLFGIGIFVGVEFARWRGMDSSRTYNTPMLLKQVQTLSELVTVKYVMEHAVVWNDPPKSLLGQLFAGENHILLLAHGIVKAGVDLGKLKPGDLLVDGRSVSIRLPPAQITDAYLDDSQTKVIERTTGFLRSFDKDLEQNVRRDAVGDIRGAAWRAGIVTDAESRARVELAKFFTQLGFTNVQFVAAEQPLPDIGRDQKIE